MRRRTILRTPATRATDIPIVVAQRTVMGAPRFVLDGDTVATALELTAGITYRLRSIEIGTDVQAAGAVPADR